MRGFDSVNAVDIAYQLYHLKRYNECVDMCIHILGLDYTRADMWNLAGIVMLELKMYQQAIAYLTQATQYEQMQESYVINLAEAHRRSGSPNQCIAVLEALLDSSESAHKNPHLHFNLAKAYSDIEDSHQSIRHYTIAIKLDPNDLGAMFNLANAQASIKQFGEAIELYINALNRGYLDAGVNLAHIYTRLGQFQEAINVYKILYVHYENDGDFLFNYANALNYANSDKQHTQALYMRSIALNPNKPEYCINYAHFLLRANHFKDGFRIYEERKRLPQMLPEFLKHIWRYDAQNVSDFSGQDVLVYYEQGLGDSIMFARFLPLLQKCAKSVQLIVQEPLVPLFETMQIQCVAHIDKITHYDVAISLLSLPLALGIRHVDELCACMPFALKASQSSHIKRVGICFSTDSKFAQASDKNIPLDILMSALATYQNTHKIEIYSLNKPECAQLEDYHIKRTQMNDFICTYNIIKDLDVVISIDTAVAHLSASMGKHTLVLLHKCYDWRWGNGISTPWYKDNVVCFTQSKMSQWDDVAHNISAYLKAWISTDDRI